MVGVRPEDVDPPGLRLAPLVGFLAAEVEGFDGSLPVTVELLAGGRSNVTYRISQRGQSWVVRRPPLGHVMETAHDMVREYRALAALAGSGVPVPRPLALCSTDEIIGSPFLVMEYVDGRVIADVVDAGRLEERQASRLSMLTIDTLAALHLLDCRSGPLGELGRPDGFLRRQVNRWTMQWEATKTRELPQAETLGSWLALAVTRLSASDRSAVVHGDFRIDNLILEHDLGAVRAVLDWEMCTLGDPVMDLATMLVYWSRPGESRRHAVPVAEGVTDGPGFWDRDALVERYVARTGIDVGHMNFCTALACFKLAAIMESIHSRTLSSAQIGRAAERGGMDQAAPALMSLGLAAAFDGLEALAR